MGLVQYRRPIQSSKKSTALGKTRIKEIFIAKEKDFHLSTLYRDAYETTPTPKGYLIRAVQSNKVESTNKYYCGLTSNNKDLDEITKEDIEKLIFWSDVDLKIAAANLMIALRKIAYDDEYGNDFRNDCQETMTTLFTSDFLEKAEFITLIEPESLRLNPEFME